LFTELFSAWDKNSASPEVFPRIHISRWVFYEEKHHWEADATWRPWSEQLHRAYHRACPDDERTEFVQIIITEYIGKEQIFNASVFQS
jgi:hypothetical protein